MLGFGWQTMSRFAIPLTSGHLERRWVSEK